MLLVSSPVSIHLIEGFENAFSGMQLIGLCVLLVALKQYDLGRFSGLSQLRRGSDQPVDEPLHLTGLHRYIRHPLYLGAYLYLWGGAVDEFGFQTALWASLYLFIGTWFEERKLISQYGAEFQVYKNKVPSLLPYKGRAI
jgi:protein-S-isoprenylcysteine O-methyltransferase Ste14